ncbi:MAG TPA: cyclic nucleotide-binding domain-containing protein [Spirochaetota bacterium]|nr:cyclic nucleotide-binding domain-containing protein [Spirochaetota bacterium]
MPESRVLKKGEILFIQGENPTRFYIMQEGEVEILSAPEEYMGLDGDLIADKSVRVCIIRGKAMLIGFSGLLTTPYTHTIRAVADTKIAEYPIAQGGYKGVAQRDINSSLNMLRQLFNNYMIAQTSMKKMAGLYIRLCQVDDNMHLLHNALAPGNGPDNLLKKSEDLYSVFTFSKGSVPQNVTIDFIIEDKAKLLKKNYNENVTVDSPGSEYLDVARRLLKLEPRLLGEVLKSDPELAVSIFITIVKSLRLVLSGMHNIIDKFERKLKGIFEVQDSWGSFLAAQGGLDAWNSTGRLSPDFLTNLKKVFQKIDAVAVEIIGKRINRYPIYPDFCALLEKGTAPSASAAAAEDAGAAEENGGEKIAATPVISTGLQKSIYQIFEFSMVEKEFQNRLLKLLNDFRNLKNPLSSESEERKVRRHITQMYWDLYKQVFARTKIESSIPRPVKLMLSFGFLDDELLTPEQLSELNDLGRIREREAKAPVFLEYEFLSKIYSGEEEPSITEMGLNYEAYLREQEKYKKRGKKGEERGDRDSGDENLNKTLHEIQQRLASSAAVCSGSTATAFPVLFSDMVRGNMRHLYQSKDKVDSLIKKLSEIDFSLFWRETVLKLDNAREIIKEEILPYFILLPICGTKTFLWQELSGNNKRSRGRIMIPILFVGDIEKSLMHTFACFRWELNRSIKGAMWADPIEGGLTGEYFDYVNTFKKNSKLSPEMKEKIALRFKSLRTNRDRFADDYMLWIEYEREGIMKLNAVVREMFFKHIPFKRDIRDQLENMPAFNKSANRYRNVQNREVTSYENRFKKYLDPSGAYPEAIEKYMNLIKM